MLLKSFSVRKLFGTFSYTINFDPKVKVYVITGPNGYGKTTILRMLHSLCHKSDLTYFYEVPFESVVVEYDNGTSLNIMKEKISDVVSDDRQIITEEKAIFNVRSRGKSIARFVLDKDKYDKMIQDSRRRRFDRKGHIFTFSFHTDDEPKPTFSDSNLDKLAMNLEIVKDKYIPAQKQVYDQETDFREDVDDSKSNIDRISESLHETMQNSYLAFLKFSQQRDSKFIDQLLSATKFYNKKEYEEKSEVLNSQIKELYSFDLLNKTTIRPYDVKHKKELSVYLNEQELKLSRYNPIRKRLKLFLSLLNDKHFVNKQFSFSLSDGLRARLVKSNSYLLNLNKLSSGEQNEIVLLYTLIFEVPDNSLLLIDEPEVSLHLEWQLQFIDDIQRIAEDKDVQIVIATHSGAIAGNNVYGATLELEDINTLK